MQLHTVIFLACQVAASGYAFVRGGTPERVVAVELAFAAAISEMLMHAGGGSFRVVEVGMLLLDLGLLAVLLPVAMYANRYWPLWVVAMQLDAIAVHGVRAIDPSLRASVYYAMVGKTAYLILLLLALGTLRHRDREARAGMREAAWIL